MISPSLMTRHSIMQGIVRDSYAIKLPILSFMYDGSDSNSQSTYLRRLLQQLGHRNGREWLVERWEGRRRGWLWIGGGGVEGRWEWVRKRLEGVMKEEEKGVEGRISDHNNMWLSQGCSRWRAMTECLKKKKVKKKKGSKDRWKKNQITSWRPSSHP